MVLFASKALVVELTKIVKSLSQSALSCLRKTDKTSGFVHCNAVTLFVKNTEVVKRLRVSAFCSFFIPKSSLRVVLQTAQAALKHKRYLIHGRRNLSNSGFHKKLMSLKLVV